MIHWLIAVFALLCALWATQARAQEFYTVYAPIVSDGALLSSTYCTPDECSAEGGNNK